MATSTQPLLSETLNLEENYDKWTPAEFAKYLGLFGLGDYSETIINNKITGKLAPLLTDEDINDLGIDIVGDRLRMRSVIKGFSGRARRTQRTKVLWEGDEKLFFGCYDGLMGTCCGLFPEDPSHYKLTMNHLSARVVTPNRIGPIKVCCGHSYYVDNIDLTNVTDVDVRGIPAPMCLHTLCCANSKAVLEVSHGETSLLEITLDEDTAPEVSQMILNQVEEAQVMERD